jgi:hypothetical protein
MAWRKITVSLAAVLAAGLTAAPEGSAQQIVQDALAILPADAVRFEYSNPSKLRSLPKYSQLRDRYLGSELKVLETSLAELGVQEGDVNELVLSWEPAEVGMAHMDGIATGRFDAEALADHAKQKGIPATPVGGMTAYCFGGDSGPLCVMAVKASVGTFGTLEALKKMADVESGQAPALATNPQFLKLVDEGRVDAPIWGVAIGPAVGDWFQGWMPEQNRGQLNWNQTFQGVEALTYNVNPSDRISVAANFECNSESATANLRQLLEAMKAFEQLAWQSQYPNRPNPYAGLQMDSSNRRVHVALTAGYDEFLPPSSRIP